MLLEDVSIWVITAMAKVGDLGMSLNSLLTQLRHEGCRDPLQVIAVANQLGNLTVGKYLEMAFVVNPRKSPRVAQIIEADPESAIWYHLWTGQTVPSRAPDAFDVLLLEED